MPTFVFKFKVAPTPDHPDFARLKSAQALAMAVRADVAVAEGACRQYITAGRWEIVSLEEGGAPVILAQLDPTGESRDVFLNAQTFGVSVIYSTTGF